MIEPGASMIGQYQIVAELGRGGMAVVYKAWQPSLARYVALKVLPEYFQHDPQFLARFQREAMSAAQLNHPNIVTIYDVGEHAGVHYIAMEYLDGGSLRERLAGQPLRAQEVQNVLGQVASALDYAHSRGLIHRDIKPANILFTSDGRAKVTDFGIARAAGGPDLTRTGVILGTPEYMAPEQAEGGVIDHRTDLYALGVVLYQMLTGQAPFRGTTPHATLHAVIYEPPLPPRQLNPGLSPAIESVLLKALSKRPEQRFHRGVDMLAAFENALRGTPVRRKPEPQTPAKPKRSPLVWILAGAAAVLLILMGMLILMALGGESGRDLALVTTQVNDRQTPTEAPAVTKQLPATEDALPVETVSVPATATQMPLAETPRPSDTTTPPTATSLPPTNTTLPPTATATAPPPPPSPLFGRLVFTSNRHGNQEIYVVNLAGGSPARLTKSNGNDWLPDWSPDGSRIAFTSERTGSYDLWVMAADGGGPNAWVTTAAWDDYARWAPDGQRLGFSTTDITEGTPNSEIFVRTADGTMKRRTKTVAEDQWPDWSPDGRIIYTEGMKGTRNWDIHTMNADGSNRSVWLGGPDCDVQPTWSPDGNWVAFIRISRDVNGNGLIDELDAGDVWVGRASGGGLRQLTAGPWTITPAWSPDSQWVAFTWVADSNSNGRSDQNDASDIYAVPVSGGEYVPLVKSPSGDWGPSWTW